MSIAMDVPDGTVAVVLLEWAPDGGLLARYAEGQDRVPATREHAARALTALAAALLEQSIDLDTEATDAH